MPSAHRQCSAKPVCAKADNDQLAKAIAGQEDEFANEAQAGRMGDELFGGDIDRDLAGNDRR